MKLILQQMKVVGSAFLLALCGLVIVGGFFAFAALTGAFCAWVLMFQPK